MASLGSLARAGAFPGPRGAAAPSRPIVDFLGIGVQKAGTTWLHRVLTTHPEIFMAEADDKDLRFFNAYYDRGYRWYERHFEGSNARRVGEFSTSYFYSKDAPERVYRYKPDMRLVLSLRDPVERLISHHKHEIRVGRLRPDISLQSAIESNPSYIEQSMYYSQLSRWLEWFPLASFKIVVFEELFRDPVQGVRDLYAFVDVSPTFVPDTLHEKVNEGRVPRSRLLDRGASCISSGVRLLGGGRMIDGLKHIGADRWLRRGNARPDVGKKLDQCVLQELRAEFAGENRKLAALLGRDLSIWNGDPPTSSDR